MSEVRRAEALGHQREAAGIAVVVGIDHDRHDERASLDAAAALAGLHPLLAEESLLAALRVGGDQRQEQVAAGDGGLDLLLPVVAWSWGRLFGHPPRAADCP